MGGSGADTYRWHRGHGNDFIAEVPDGSKDVLFFESGIKRTDVKVPVNLGVSVTYSISGRNGGVITVTGGSTLHMVFAEEDRLAPAGLPSYGSYW